MYHNKEFDSESSDTEPALGAAGAIRSCRAQRAAAAHYGPYSKLPEAYRTVTKWISENGCEIAAPPYEMYVTPPIPQIFLCGAKAGANEPRTAAAVKRHSMFM